LAKTPTLLAKAFPTGFPSSYWERTVGVLSDEKELFANRNADPVGKASPTAMCTIGEGGTPSARLSLPSPTGEATAVGKGNGSFANSLVCQQHRSMLLANPLDKTVGKAGNFFPFSFAIF
jgi:hypothetical protein